MIYRSKHLKKPYNRSIDVAIRSGIITISAIFIVVCGYFAARFFSGG